MICLGFDGNFDCGFVKFLVEGSSIRMSCSVLNLGLSSNSNHFITCLLIFVLHYSPQLRPAFLFNLNECPLTTTSSSSSSNSPISSNSTLINHNPQFSNRRSSFNGVQEQE